MNPFIQLIKTTALIFAALICFGLLPTMQAAVPAPDGGYANFTTAEGTNALLNLTTGAANTAVGWYALFSAGDASNNTGVGAGALALNNGISNTAVGTAALLFNTNGIHNVAVGTAALANNNNGILNTAVGSFALYNNIDGDTNNAFGTNALSENIHADDNTAFGFSALSGNDHTGNGVAARNTAVGSRTMESNLDGADNTAAGYHALTLNTTGSNNTAVGNQALISNTTGTYNIAIGSFAGSNLTGDLNIDIGNQGIGGESSTIRIGNTGQTATYIAGIYGTTVGGTGAAVYIDQFGQLGTNPSTRRLKKDIKPMDRTSEALLALKPVTFHYKSDKTNTPQFGLVAEEVAAVNADLVMHDRNGEIYSVRYEAVNAMLLNEFLKEHRAFLDEKREVQEMEATIAKQQKDFQATATHQQKQIEALTAGLQKVSARLELSKSAPQTVLNSQ